MIRPVAVVVLAAFCAALFGLGEPVRGAQTDAAQAAAHRQAISTRASEIPVGAIVRVERNDGRRVDGVLREKMADSLTVDVYEQRAFRSPRLVRTETVAFDDIKEIRRPLSTAQKVLIGVGVFAGACAIITTATFGSQQPGQPPAQEPPTAQDLESPAAPAVESQTGDPDQSDPD